MRSLYLSSIALGFLAGLFGSFVGFRFHEADLGVLPETIVETRVLESESAVIEVVEQSQDAVVSIVASKDIPIFEQYYYNPFGFGGFGIPQQGEQIGTEEVEIGSGSGFIVREDGLIVTNRHVVDDQEAEYTVVLNGGELYEAEVIARDTLYDLAFLRIEGGDFLTLDLGDSSGLKVGQGAVAIGNALGEFSNTVSTGIVSGLGRNLSASSGNGSVALHDVIQTDASINPGNSGGPLLDFAGNVIGVNVAVASNAENIGFAIPIDAVKSTLMSLDEYGEIVRPYLGVRFALVTPAYQEANDLDYDYGAIIRRGATEEELAVIPGSPADEAGLLENDIILEVEGVKVDVENPLNVLVQSHAIGETITLKVFSKGDEKEVQMELRASE